MKLVFCYFGQLVIFVSDWELKVYDSLVSVMMVVRKASKLALGPDPSSYSVGTGAHPPRVKELWCKADHSPPCIAKVKNEWSHTSTPPYHS